MAEGPTVSGTAGAGTTEAIRDAKPQDFNVRAPANGAAIFAYNPDSIVRSPAGTQRGSMSTEAFGAVGRDGEPRDPGHIRNAALESAIGDLEKELARRGSSGSYGAADEIRIARNGQTWDQAAPLSHESLQGLRNQLAAWRAEEAGVDRSDPHATPLLRQPPAEPPGSPRALPR